MAYLAFFFLKNALMSVMIFAAAGHGARNIRELQHYYGADQNMMTITSSTHDHVIPLAKGDDRTSAGHVIPLGIADPRKPCRTITVRKCRRDDTTRSAAAAA